jgi:hypothetical protein
MNRGSGRHAYLIIAHNNFCPWGRKFNENVDQTAIDLVVDALRNKTVTE